MMIRPGSVKMVRPPCWLSRRWPRKSSRRCGPARAAHLARWLIPPCFRRRWRRRQRCGDLRRLPEGRRDGRRGVLGPAGRWRGVRRARHGGRCRRSRRRPRSGAERPPARRRGGASSAQGPLPAPLFRPAQPEAAPPGRPGGGGVSARSSERRALGGGVGAPGRGGGAVVVLPPGGGGRRSAVLSEPAWWQRCRRLPGASRRWRRRHGRWRRLLR